MDTSIKNIIYYKFIDVCRMEFGGGGRGGGDGLRHLGVFLPS